MDIHPQRLQGCWAEGWALDLHTTSSRPTLTAGWLTERTAVGEELYHLKYELKREHLPALAEAAANFLKERLPEWRLDLIVPVPPSDTSRPFQPVEELARAIGALVGVPVVLQVLRKVRPTSQLKEIEDAAQRRALLQDVFYMASHALHGLRVLVFDDLYRSGETLRAVCEVVLQRGKAAQVYVLTLTKTRSKR